VEDLSAISPSGSLVVVNVIQDFLNGTKSNLNELSATLKDATAFIPRDTNRTQYNNILILLKTINDILDHQPKQNETYPAGSYDVPTDGGQSKNYLSSPQEQINTQKTYPSIPKEVQNKLGKILAANGWGLFTSPDDGKLGKDTRFALETFRNNNPKFKYYTDTGLFDEILKYNI
jgi:hypothetical protein